jgi:glucose/arabinose dehydrogenase
VTCCFTANEHRVSGLRQSRKVMTISKPSILAALLTVVLAPGLTPGHLRAQQPSSQWVVPAGFQVATFADSVQGARAMALGPRGTVFVGSQRAGRVHAVVDRDGDHKADRVVVIASGLDQPNGVAMRNGALYVATASKILRFDDIERRLDAPPAPVVVRDSLPNPNVGHTWKFIAFGPDDLLYMSVGAPCNVCLSPPLVSAIVRMKPDGSNLEPFAEGVRNSVGFDWHPTSRELWFTDNGRDMLGDDVPGDELNVAWKPGLHFGFPFCHQGDVTDPQFGAQRACSTTEPPAKTLGAHVAAIGMTFYTGTMFPASYKNAVIGDSAFVLVERTRAVVVPYRPRKLRATRVGSERCVRLDSRWPPRSSRLDSAPAAARPPRRSPLSAGFARITTCVRPFTSSRREQRLDRAALVHRAVPLGHLVERQRSEAKKEPMTNCPFRTDVTAPPTSSTMPQYSWPIGAGASTGCAPRYGHRSDPQMQLAESRMIASVGATMVGSGRSSKRTSPGPYRTVPFMTHSPRGFTYRIHARAGDAERQVAGVVIPPGTARR